MKKYEVMYIINESVETEKRAELIETLSKIITDNGGKIAKTDEWGMREFAYHIDDMKKGCYVVTAFEADNACVKAVSYTHLDVYKRQVLQVMENDWFFADQVENIDTKLTDQALKGITTNDVDKHTEYMTADEMKQFTDSINRNYVGIGVQFLQANGINIIERVFRNSPADKAGVKAGDIMNKVNGESLTGKTTEEIKNLVQGDSGTDVTIEFIRQEQPLEITITRAAVSATAFGEILSDNTGYLQIYQFGENTTNEAKAYLDDFKNANVSNIVIDLRDNGGGYLTALQGIASVSYTHLDVYKRQH